MTIRTTRRTVYFTQPFRLPGIDGVQPAGSYEVVTDEESIDEVSFLAWRRIATTISVGSAGVTQTYHTDPTALEASLLKDAGMTVLPATR